MKVLFSHSFPFFLAHGGVQTWTEALMRELSGLGIEVEPERWWDGGQRGDILHYVSRPPSAQHVRFAHEKGFKVVMTEFLDQTASRSPLKLFLQRQTTRLARTVLGGMTARLAWDVYKELDAMVYAVEHEWEAARYLFDAKPERGHIIPHGLEEDALRSLALPQSEGDYLVSVATIVPRKRTLLLAEAALKAQVPIVFLGKPYAPDDPYFQEFKQRVDGHYVRYPGFVSVEEKHQFLRGARGFALLSEFESGCIAIYEAAAAGLPFFLPNLPWAARVYDKARGVQFTNAGSPNAVASDLANFYSQARRSNEQTFSLLSWRQVAQRYLAIYEDLLATNLKVPRA